jgi:hypothetical protein
VQSTILGILLAAGTWIIRGTLFLDGNAGAGRIIQNWGSIQEIIFPEAYSLAAIFVLIVVYFILNSGGGSTISVHSPHRAACSRLNGVRCRPFYARQHRPARGGLHERAPACVDRTCHGR